MTFIVVVILTAFAAGCNAVLSNSTLVDKEHAVYHPDLVGKWVSYQNQTPVLNIEAGKDPETYTATLSGLGEYRAVLGRWENDEFAEVEFLSAPTQEDGEFKRVFMPGPLFCRVRHDGDLLWLAFMGSDWAEKHCPQVNQSKTREGVFIFTGPSADFQKFVLQNAHESTAFHEFRLARQGSLAARAETLPQVRFDSAQYLPARDGDPVNGALVFNTGMKHIEFLRARDQWSWFGLAPVEFSIPNASVKSMLYEKTSKRFWPLLLAKSTTHYLTIHYTDASGADRFVTVHLDKRNYQRALAAVEAETGIKVKHAQGK
jgi:hypothetical protein